MALIYASAVNKRMNAPRQKRSLAEGASCMETSISHSRQRSNEEGRSTQYSTNGIFDVPLSRERTRKRSTSQHSGTNSSCACTPPPQSATPTAASSHRDLADSERSKCPYASVQRSKTTAADLKRKIHAQNSSNSRHAPARKISTPVMAQSVIFEPTYKQRERQYSERHNLRKKLAKKRLVQEKADSEERTRLAVSDSSSDVTEDEDGGSPHQPRRRSLSADAIREHNHQSGLHKQRGGSSKVSAFQKMCSRLQKWSFHSNPIGNQQH